MATAKQLEANRRNARVSTGPRSPAGKAVVRLNNFRHGLRCTLPVVPDVEHAADWEEHLAGVLDSLGPAGALEEALAGRVALMLWRLNRVVRYETSMIAVAQDKAREDVRKVDQLDEILKKDAPAVRLKVAIREKEKHAQGLGWAESALAAAGALGGPGDAEVDGGEAGCLLEFAREAMDIDVDLDDEDFLAGLGAAGGYDRAWTAGMVRAGLARLAAHDRDGRWDVEVLVARVRATLRNRQAEGRREAGRLAKEVRAAEQAVATLEERTRARRLMPEEPVMQAVGRYEAHLERGLYRALHELHRLQAVRAGQHVPPPVVLDVTVDGPGEGRRRG